MTVEELERDLVYKSKNNLILNQTQQYPHQKTQMLPEQFFIHIQQQRFQQQQQQQLLSTGNLENMKTFSEFQNMDPMVVSAMMQNSAYLQQNLNSRHQQDYRISNKISPISSKISVRLIYF